VIPYDAAEEAGAWLRARAKPPRVAIVLGSGLGGLAERLTPVHAWTYDAIPHMRAPTVAGHGGQLILGALPDDGPVVAAFSGRVHLYEGLGVDIVCHPMRMLARWGVKAVVLTNAAGGVAEGLSAGDLVRLVHFQAVFGHQPGEKSAIHPPGHIAARRNAQKRAGVIVKSDSVVEPCRFGDLLAEPAHAFGAIVEPPRRPELEDWVVPCQRSKFARIACLI